MANEDVVRRNPKHNRRKNTDGYRTDSGCFEDVDVQMASRHSPFSTPAEPVVFHRENVMSSEHSNLTNASSPAPSLADDCADDKDFHAILKRLSDITTDPSDLYRLCFSSRLSFCGHMSGNEENEELFGCQKDENQNDTTVFEQTNNCTNCEVPDESVKRSSHGRQCADLLAMLSSFMVKAKEDPSMLNHSSLGPSIVTQLSSLLSTIGEAKANIGNGQSNEGQSMTTCRLVPPDSFKPIHVAVSECTALPELNANKHETSLYAQNSNELAADLEMTLKKSKKDSDQEQFQSNKTNADGYPTSNNDHDVLREQLFIHDNIQLSLSQNEQHENALPTALEKRETSLPTINLTTSSADHPTSENSSESEEKHILFSKHREDNQCSLPAPSIRHSTGLKTNNTSNSDPKSKFPSNTKKQLLPSQRENLQTPSAHTSSEDSYAGTAEKTFVDDVDATSLRQCNDQGQQPTAPVIRDVVGRSSTSSITDENDVFPLLGPSNIQDKPPLRMASEDGKTIPDVHRVDCRSSISSITDADDVVTSGRRAVKPYSWDYGDIWEKEIETDGNAASANSREGCLNSRKNAPTDMMPSFEEIRDELFQNAGFFKTHNSKRRSRSADAR